MSAKTKTLAKLINSVTRYSDRTSQTLTRTSATSAGQETNLKSYVQLKNAVTSSPKSSNSKKPSSSKLPSVLALDSNRVDTSSSLSESARALSAQLSTIMCEDADDLGELVKDDTVQLLEIPWLEVASHVNMSIGRKERSRDRKQDWTFKSTQGNRFGRLVKMCTQKLGANGTIQVFGKLHRETGLKEFNAMIEICIQRARDTDDEDVALEEFHRAYMVFETMRERGFEIGEVTYGPFLMFLVDMGMVEEFHFFCDSIKKENPKSLKRLAYYEMLLWIRVGDEDKIQNLIADTCDNKDSNFIESYLVALMEADMQGEVSMLLEKIDVKKVSSKESMERIFKSLGRLQLEFHAKKFIQELKSEGNGEEHLLKLIYDYAMSIPNLQAEDIVVKFKSLQAELKIESSSIAYEKLIKTCCDYLEVQLAIDLVDSLLNDGLDVHINTINSILTACHASCEYNLVRRIKIMINDHKIVPNLETFSTMISLLVKLKDFDGAYEMIKDVEKFNQKPSSNMYNAIMGGYFRQKNYNKGLMVLKQMEASGVAPDSHTFSYIIGNCNSEEDIIKYREELREAHVQPTKHIFMAYINAYAACGLFEKAKQVLSDNHIPDKNRTEIKSVLVSALAANGQMADALEVYDEIKQEKATLEPKSIICLIEHLKSEGELDRLLQLLSQLENSELWDDGCGRIILYCVRHKLLDSAVDLLKQRTEKFSTDEAVIEVVFDEVFYQIAEIEPTDVQFGLDLLQVIKEDIGIRPSRKSLDFLLSACVSAKDLQRSYLVWKEYPAAGLPYNVLTSVRMYQALMASGAFKAAKILLENIPDDDPHVRFVLKACRDTFANSSSSVVETQPKKKKKRTKRKKKAKKTSE
ncbi:pentatricopeptide repeat-containing protein At4g04790, mitochondrial-like [Rutidosis leptorrhynchoides]|uniref:pentatricopeptide repeat-containing protein At4g04790, mitochondrial-like n=1 Tax=Rutidosis leptorrhynchoides TaxID=125765 RepID=UPI003A99377D